MAETNIPASAREFERWYEERKSDWPQELQDAGLRALLTLKMMVGQAREHAQSAALSRRWQSLRLSPSRSS